MELVTSFKRNTPILLSIIFLTTALLTFQVFNSKAQDKKNDSINIGMSAAFRGPAKQLGINMRKGIQAYFNKINDQGGIEGKKLKLFSRDDSYEPKYASSNVFRLINNNGVTTFIGNVGTPTAKAATPITLENKI